MEFGLRLVKDFSTLAKTIKIVPRNSALIQLNKKGKISSELYIAIFLGPLLKVLAHSYVDVTSQILVTSVNPDAVTLRERTLLTSVLLGHPEGRSRFLKNASASAGHSSSCSVSRKSMSSSIYSSQHSIIIPKIFPCIKNLPLTPLC